VVRPEPVVAAVTVPERVDEAPDADEPLFVHVQAETFREVPEHPGQSASQLIQLLLAHQELARLSADGAGLPAKVSVLAAFP